MTEEVYGDLIGKIGRAALRHVGPKIDSVTLRRAVRYERLSRSRGRLFIPHYWAIYQHDGRGSVRPQTARSLVFFVDPKDDPRLRGGYPIRVKDIRKLTRDEFEEGQRMNQEMYAQSPGGGRMQYMVIINAVGPTRPNKSYKFFEDGMRMFPQEAGAIALRHIRQFMSRYAVRRSASVIIGVR